MSALAQSSGLIALADSVRRYFELKNIGAVVPPVGLRSRNLWGQSRVVLIPGEFAGDASPRPLREGRLTAPEHMTSDNPRELATWERTITAAILAVDKTAPQDEQAQIQASERLLERTVQALWNAYDPARGLLAGQGSIVFDGGSVSRMYPPVEQPYGIELLLVFQQRGPLYDEPSVEVTPEFVLHKTLSAPGP